MRKHAVRFPKMLRIFISLTSLLRVKLTCQIRDTTSTIAAANEKVCAIDKIPGAANRTPYLHLTGAQKYQMGNLRYYVRHFPSIPLKKTSMRCRLASWLHTQSLAWTVHAMSSYITVIIISGRQTFNHFWWSDSQTLPPPNIPVIASYVHSYLFLSLKSNPKYT